MSSSLRRQLGPGRTRSSRYLLARISLTRRLRGLDSIAPLGADCCLQVDAQLLEAGIDLPEVAAIRS